MFEGLTVAMVTPFRDGGIDLEATAQLIDFMIDGGVEGLVVSGSTGEAATCTVDERRSLWRVTRERVRSRVPVIAGTGTNNTAESITLTRMAEELGLDGAMLVTPYYNRPTARGQNCSGSIPISELRCAHATPFAWRKKMANVSTPPPAEATPGSARPSRNGSATTVPPTPRSTCLRVIRIFTATPPCCG